MLKANMIMLLKANTI